MAVATVYAQPYKSEGNTTLGNATNPKSNVPYFQVDQIKGCAPLTITVTNLLAGECAGAKPCVFYYEAAPPANGQQNTITHTYTTPGTYRLAVLYTSIGYDYINITVVANTQPEFEIHSCAANGARIKVNDNKYDQYAINFGDGSPEVFMPFTDNILTPSHTYTPPPTSFTTAVRGINLGAIDNCTAKTQAFTPITTLPVPKINTLTSVDATSVKLDFVTAPNILYKLEVALNNSTSFQVVQNVYGVNTLTVPNLKLDENFYCFRLSSFDECAGTNAFSSNIVCSDKFSVTAQSDVNQLLFPTANLGAVASFNIARVDGSNTTSIPVHTTGYNDVAIICKTNYCYKITTVYTDGSSSISLQKCITSISNKVPTLIDNATAVVNANNAGVKMTWLQDPAFIPKSYSILRSSGGGPFAFLSTASTAEYTDAEYTSSNKFCYRINYLDRCDNPSPQGSTVCPVRLDGTIDKKNAITLIWTGYKGWKNGVKNYTLEKYNLQGGLISSVTLTDTTYLDDQVDPVNQLVKYEIKTTANEGNLGTSVSNTVEFIKNANLFYPTAFTPNNDNLNDLFIVQGQYVAKINMRIFDRWGALVFVTEKNEPWNGFREGKLMPPSTYVWKVEITDLAGRTFSKEGIVALIKN